MQRIIRGILVLLLGAISLSAMADYTGNISENCDIRFRVSSDNAEVKSSPSVQAFVSYRLVKGDLVYVENDKFIHAEGIDWVKVSGEKNYVKAELLSMEENPYYKAKEADEVFGKIRRNLGLGDDNLPKWLAITMLVAWIVLSAAAMVLMYGSKTRGKYLGEPYMPGLTEENKEKIGWQYGYGMSKIFFFRKSPYQMLLTVALVIVAAFVVTILLTLLIGGLIWLVCLLGKWIIISLFWILVAALVIGGILLIICTGFNILGIIGGVLIFALAGWIYSFWDALRAWCESVYLWGVDAWHTLNIFPASLYVVKHYSLPALGVALTPFLILVACALVFGILAGGLMLYEKIKLKNYNIKHPCPVCGQNSEPAEYSSHGVALHVHLRPSVWGLLHIRHPYTGEKMPTLFINGKGNLQRRCGHCGAKISAEVGIDKHLAFAGLPDCGKTSLMYRLISEFLRKQSGDAPLFHLTDSVGTETKEIVKQLENGGPMAEFPAKTSASRQRAIQLIGDNGRRSFPYRLYMNDVSGEQFNNAGADAADGALDMADAFFIPNTNAIVFVVDPIIGIQRSDLSGPFADWFEKNAPEDAGYSVTNTHYNAGVRLCNIVRHFAKKSKEITLYFTLVKSDLGYLESIDSSDSEALKAFADKSMGLGNVIRLFENEGFKIEFAAVSAKDDVKSSGIGNLVDSLMEVLDVSLDKVSEEKMLAAAERQKQLKKREERRYKKYNWKDHNPFSSAWYTGWPSIAIAFAILIIVIVLWAVVSKKVERKNYEGIAQRAELVLTSNPTDWAGAQQVISDGVATKRLSDSQQFALSEKYQDIESERKIYIYNLRTTLSACFKKVSGKSQIEESFRQGDLDAVRLVASQIAQYESLNLNDDKLKEYRQEFDRLIQTYDVRL